MMTLFGSFPRDLDYFALLEYVPKANERELTSTGLKATWILTLGRLLLAVCKRLLNEKKV
jgi:hypothetical protein